MNNSAWYNRLWRRKLENLRVKVDADQAWADMRQQLDTHMPVDKASGNGNARVSKSTISKIISLLTYALPAAAMVWTITYLPVRYKENHKPHSKKPVLRNCMPVSRHNNPDDVALPDIANTQKGLQNAATLIQPTIKSKDTLLLQNLKMPDNGQLTVGGPKKTDSMGNDQLTQSASKNNLGIPTYYTVNRGHGAESKSGIYTPANRGYYNVKNLRSPLGKGIEFESKRYIGDSINSNSINRRSRSLQINQTGNVSQISRLASITDILPLPTVNNDLVSSYLGFERRSELTGAETIRKVNDRTKKTHQPRAKNNDLKDKTLLNLFSNPFGKSKSSKSSPVNDVGFSYGLKLGYAAGNINPNFYLGGYTSFDIDKHWYFNPVLVLNSARALSGSYLHESYFRPDSIPPFTIVDYRKVYFLDLNLNMGYRLTKSISINAGPVISTPFKQSDVDSKAGYVPDMRDTLMHQKAINSSLANTALNPKLSIGVAGGINIQLRRFSLEASYQYNLAPYRVSSDLGNYKLNYHSFKIGIGFQFNKGR